MNNLILFSLKRRFLTPTFAIICLIFALIAGCGFFSDKIVYTFIPNIFDKQIIYIDENLAYLQLETDLFELKYGELKDIIPDYFYLSSKQDSYLITYDSYLPPKTYQKILHLIQEIEFQKLIYNNFYSELNIIDKVLNPLIELNPLNEISVSPFKQDLSLFVLSSAYFFVLGFCTLIANEVVSEKSNRVMEIILTSVSSKTHFISKIIIGWFAIIIHLLINIGILLTFLFIRNFYDQGVGLIKLLTQFKLIDNDILTFKELILSLSLTKELVLSLLLVFIFLMIGVLLIQIILVVLSSFVSNIEEAGAIAGPTYIILLIVYYLALLLNTPAQLNNGIGYILSFLPFFSMLFMPCRIIIGQVIPFELLISFSLATISLIISIMVGHIFYKKGVLNYKKRRKLFFKIF